jgi:DNA end-binding protein Ku
VAAKKVTIMVGFVPIATRIDVAVDKESSDYHAVCTGTDEQPHDPARVRQTVGCPVCGISHSSVYPFGKRGVERDGKVVVLTSEEIAAASGVPRTGRKDKDQPPVELAFHPREKVYAATVAGDSVQNVYPDKGGEKAYALLRDTLLSHPDVVAVMIWAPTSKNALWVLEVVGQRIVATKRCWPEYVRPTMEIPAAEVTDQERAMFTQLIESTVEDFDLLTYVDESKKSLAELVAAKAGGAKAVAAGPVPTASNTNLLAALEASLAVAKPRAVPTPKKRPAKKAAAKKAAPRKRAAKKVALPESA